MLARTGEILVQFGYNLRSRRLRLMVGAAHYHRVAGRDRAAVLEHRLDDRPARRADAANAGRDPNRVGEMPLGEIVDLDRGDHRPLVRRPLAERTHPTVQQHAAAFEQRREGHIVEVARSEEHTSELQSLMRTSYSV